VGAHCVLWFEGGDGVRSVMFFRERGAIVHGWGGVLVVHVSLRVVVVVGACCTPWFVVQVVVWVFGRGPWDLHFVLSVERERGSSLTGRTKTTNNDEYHRRSSSGCHVAIGMWHLVCRPSCTSPSLVVVHGHCRSSFSNGRPSSWTLPSTWHARVNRWRATSTVSQCRLLAVAGIVGERGMK
jgi:hypothetical protein